MKRTVKRILAILLTVVMLLSVAPAAMAKGSTSDNVAEGAVSDVNLKATNPIGKALVDEYQDSSEEEAYTVNSVQFNGKTATVAFGNLEACNVVVAIYNEEGKMLATGIKKVEAMAMQTDVTININVMPEHFLCQVFLLDENNASLCRSLKSIENTEYYEEFMAKTIDDFDDDSIIVNFDEQKDDNFAVLADGAVDATGDSETNVLVSADEDNAVYKFSNINDDIKNLEAGDVFKHGKTNDDLIIVKVKSISVSGTNATIYGDKDADVRDYFDFVKIDLESTGAEDDMNVDMSGADDGVEYCGNEEWNDDTLLETESVTTESVATESVATESAAVDNEIFETSEKVEKNHSAQVSCPVWKMKDKYLVGDKYSTFNVKISCQIKASITYNFQLHYDAELELNYKKIWGPLGYIDVDYNDYYYAQVQFDNSIKGSVSLSGNINKDIYLGAVDFVTPVGITCGIGFRIHVEFSVAATITIAKISNTIGFRYSDNEGWVNLSTAPKVELFPTFDSKASVKIGLKISPNVSLIKVLEIAINPEIGVSAEMTLYTTDDDVLTDHICKVCFPGTFSLYFKVSITGNVFRKEVKSFSIVPEIKKELTKFYWSLDYHEFGLGMCPHTKSNSGGETGGSTSDGTGSKDSGFTGTEATGTIINFGSYPQSRVNDTVTINNLEGVTKNWKSYNYYSGTGNWSDGNMTSSDYMLYADFLYGGEKYRAVTFSEYRPCWTGYTSSTSNTYQDDNGYYTNNTYYFKYEPLKWRVLDASTGLIVCDSAIDSQAYNNYVLYADSTYWGNSGKDYYASNWENSSLRSWLNNEFYNTAFSEAQQAKIQKLTRENKSTGSSTYDSNPTSDKITLLSYNDVLNTSYGFSSSYSAYDTARQRKSTDYAQCQGCWTSTSSSYSGNSWWWLRSPCGSVGAAGVSDGGWASSGTYVYNTCGGIVPALNLSQSKIDTSSITSGEIAAEDAADENTVGTSQATQTVFAPFANGEFTLGSAVNGNLYMVYGVTDYNDGFTLTSDNLVYIDQSEAADGKVTLAYKPSRTDEATVLVVGDFGSGVEARQVELKTGYTVTWNIDGKAVTEIYAAGDKLTPPTVPTKDGYTFKGWDKSVPSTMPANDLTFTAVYEKTSVKSVSIGDITMNYKKSAKINPSITADDGTEYTVKYSSSDTSVARVDDNGNVYAAKRGSATITCTVTDSNDNTVTDTCNVNVKYSFGQWLIVILLFGWIWY